MSRKKLEYDTDKELDGIRWLARVIDFGVSLTITTAINELYTSHMMLRERPDFYHGKVKHQANLAEQEARMQSSRIMSLMTSRRFFDAYSDRVIDLAENDITLFRISLKQTLDDENFPNSELFSYLETSRALLEAAVHHFNSVLETALDDYSDELPYTPRYLRRIVLEKRWRKAFYEFDCTMLYRKWNKCCELLYDTAPNIDLNTQHSTQLFDNLLGHFADGDYVRECLNEAHAAEPNFLMNMILVKK